MCRELAASRARGCTLLARRRRRWRESLPTWWSHGSVDVVMRNSPTSCASATIARPRAAASAARPADVDDLTVISDLARRRSCARSARGTRRGGSTARADVHRAQPAARPELYTPEVVERHAQATARAPPLPHLRQGRARCRAPERAALQVLLVAGESGSARPRRRGGTSCLSDGAVGGGGRRPSARRNWRCGCCRRRPARGSCNAKTVNHNSSRSGKPVCCSASAGARLVLSRSTCWSRRPRGG